VEQLKATPLNHATDQWSWAATLLYMFSGSVTWQYGIFAPAAFAKFLAETSFTVIPEPVSKVMDRCFQEDPGHRWSSMDEVADKLIEGYRDFFGQDYFRERPVYRKSPVKNITVQENPVTSYEVEVDDLIRTVVEKVGLDVDTQMKKMPKRKGSISAKLLVNLERLNRIDKMIRELVSEGDPDGTIYQIEAMLLKSSLLKLTDDLPGALRQMELAIPVHQELEHKVDDEQWLKYGEYIHRYRGGYFNETRSLDDALTEFQKAETFAERLVEIDKSNDTYSRLCRLKMNLAVIYGKMGKLEKSIEIASGSIDQLDQLKGVIDEKDRLRYLAGSYTNKAASLGYMDRDQEAADLFLKAADVIECLIEEHNEKGMYFRLVHTSQNAANAMMYCGNYSEAERLAEKVIKIIREHLSDDSREAIQSRLQASDIVIHILSEAGKIDQALEKVDVLIAVLENKIYRRGKDSLVPLLIKMIKGRLSILEKKEGISDAELQDARDLVERVERLG